MKIENKKSNQTYFENSNILKMKTENENTNQICQNYKHQNLFLKKAQQGTKELIFL